MAKRYLVSSYFVVGVGLCRIIDAPDTKNGQKTCKNISRGSIQNNLLIRYLIIFLEVSGERKISYRPTVSEKQVVLNVIEYLEIEKIAIDRQCLKKQVKYIGFGIRLMVR